MPAQRLSLSVVAAIGAAVALFLVAHATGAISLVGYETKSLRQVGPLTTGGPFNVSVGMPVWLRQGEAVAAAYDVDAKFGAVVLAVHPPLFLRTPLQAARFYVEGQKGGTVHFVARSAGWYTFSASASPLGGPRCDDGGAMPPLIRFDPACPTYDVRYQVTWRRADAAATQARTSIAIPRPGETLVTARAR